MSKKDFNETNLAYLKKIMEQYAPATYEENVELAKRVHAGDDEARELMILKNVGLIVKVVSNYKKERESFQEDDLAQEGIFGLMHAIDNYDENDGAFSTYAFASIKGFISNSLAKTDKMVRRSSKFLPVLHSYKKYIREYIQNNLPLPTDDTICRDLGITLDRLNTIRLDSNLNTRSISEHLNDDADSDTLEEIIGMEETDYKSVLDKMADDEMAAYLKIRLSKLDYYIIYNRFLRANPLSIKETGMNMGIPYETVRFFEKQALSKLKDFFDDTGSFKYSIDNDTRRLLELGYFKIEPISPQDIAKFLFLRDYLSPLEKELYIEKYLSDIKYSSLVTGKKMGLDSSRLKSLEEELERKISSILEKNAQAYDTFTKNVIEHFKQDIFEIDLDINVEDFKKDYRYVASLWNDKSYEDLVAVVGEESIPDALRDKVKTYFGYRETVPKQKSLIERKLNCLIFGLYERDIVSKSQLYSAFTKKRCTLTPLQNAKASLFFGKMTKEEFVNLFPNFSLSNSTDGLFELLNSLYFNITNYNRINFDVLLYRRIKKQCKSELPKDASTLLDYYFSLNGDNALVMLAEFLKTSPKKASLILQQAKTIFLNTYIGRTVNLKLNLDIYRRYLSKNKLDLGSPTNAIIELYLFQNKTYEEIASKFGVSTSNISKIVTNALWRIDYSRFNILADFPYSNRTLIATLQESNFDAKIKAALQEYIIVRDAEYISQKYGISSKDLGSFMTKLYHLCRSKTLENITLDIHDIKREISAYETENVLSMNSRKILSLYYGIKNMYNEEGLKYNTVQIASLLGVTEPSVVANKNRALDDIKAKVAGIEKAPLDFIKKDELRVLLDDPHIPLKNSEKELLKSLYSLDGKCMTLEEMSQVTDKGIKTLRFNLYRAIVDLRRYQNGEIEGKISFDVDVEPYLRYFTLHDRGILKSLYRDEKTYEEVEKEYGYTYAEFTNIMLRLRVYLKECSQGFPPCIDFDKFYENYQKEDVPFYGNRELAVELFTLFYEQSIPIKEIVRKYHPELSERVVQSNITIFTIAVMKRSIGIKKVKDFSYDEVRSYYLAHQSEMSIARKKHFYNYFRTVEKNTAYFRRQISPLIVDLMLREQENYLRLDSCDKDMIRKLIVKYRTRLTKSCINTLLERFNIHPREFMKGSDQKQVLDFLYHVTYTHEKVLTLQSQN